MNHNGVCASFMRRCIVNLLMMAAFSATALAAEAQDFMRYEYKIVKLGSLTSLQKKEDPQAELGKIEALLNGPGAEGWEMVNLFAVRTTFDPNVFFVVMKRPLSRGAVIIR